MAFEETQKQAVALSRKLVESGAKERHTELLRDSTRRTLSDDEVNELAQLDRSMVALAFMRKHAGWTPDEVKAMGKDAWRTHAMFANELDLKTRGPDVAATLGLPANQQTINQFLTAQSELLTRIRDVRGK